MMTIVGLSPQQRSERRRQFVKLVRHLRKQEGLSIIEIAERLDLRPKTVSDYLSDPEGAKARARKQRYRGTCRECGRPTSGGDGRHRARGLCQSCKGALIRKWDRGSVLDAMLEWQRSYGALPTSTDLNPTHARTRGAEAWRRLQSGNWPRASTVREIFGSWAAARAEAERAAGLGPARRTSSAMDGHRP